MSLQIRLGDFITSVGTDYKNFKTWMFGSLSGSLSDLVTIDKSSFVAAINEVKTGSAGAPPDASTTVKGVIETSTDAETNTGSSSTVAVTPASLTSKIDTDGTLTANSDTKIPSQQAVKEYVDAGVAGATIPDASSTVKGKAELSTDPEAITGTDTVRVTTPANVAAVFADKIDTNAALGASNTKIPSQAAVKAYADGLLDANNAYQYKGFIDASANPNYPAASAGHTYKISVAGKIGGASGADVEIGDSVTCIVDGTSAGNQATVGANWLIIQTNIDGAMIGPASSTAGNLVTFAGITGKVTQDSGVSISTDGTLATNNNTKLPTEGAIRTYLAANFYTETELGDPETDLAAAYATAKA